MTESAEESAAPIPPGRFVIITGLSGSGKSLAHRCFEDMGYFCVDNLPIELIPKFQELQERGGGALGRVALTVDVREREFLSAFPSVYHEVRERDPAIQLMFLEASDETLVKRFSETRRPHPLSAGRTLLEGIAQEKELLAPLRGLADILIDTTAFTGHELRQHLFARYAEPGADRRLQVNLLSFGFRHGLPKEADLVFDVRFLPNPFYVEALRPQSGRDEAVRTHLEGMPEYGEFVRRLQHLLELLLPAYEKEGKSYLTIAIGCTGGRHRSVAITEKLHDWMKERGVKVARSHRDCDRHPA
jgi:UPF0042 nucleotide-binding protein